MNFKKKGAVAAVLLSGTLLFSGCSFSDVMDRWMGMEVDTVNESVDTSSSDQEVFTVDSSLEAPVFTRDLSGSMQMTVDSEYTLHVEASVSGGGTVTYQCTGTILPPTEAALCCRELPARIIRWTPLLQEPIIIMWSPQTGRETESL